MNSPQIAPAAAAPVVMMPRFRRMLERQRLLETVLRGAELTRAVRAELHKLWGDDPDHWYKLAQFSDREWFDDRLGGIVMAVATANFPNMAALVANSGGAVETLPGVNTTGGRQRTWIDTLTLASQASASVIAFARIPLYSAPLCFELTTDTSLGSATIAFGDPNSSALFTAAATLTSTNTPTRAHKAATKGVVITSGYDSVTGNLVSPFMPQTPGQGGLGYEDIVMTTAAAALPASGNLNVMLEYLGPDS